MAARKKRAKPARKVARRRAPRRVVTTTTTRVVRVGNPRRNASSTAAIRKRIAALQAARERRTRQFHRVGAYESIHGAKARAPRGFTTHGAGSKDAALTEAQRRAERVFHRRVRPGQRSFFFKNPERPDWGANVKHWTPARRAAWRRSSEAAKFRTFKMGEIIDRRRAVYLKRHGSPGPGVMPPQLAARHAAYRRSWDVEMRRQAREAREEARERRKARRRNPMAKRKRTAAQRRAFRKMLAGLRRHQARKNPGRKRRRGRARRRKTTTVVVATNPRRKRRKNSSRGGSHMAKRRRHRRRNPARRHHRRRNPHRRYHRRRRNPGGGGLMSMVKTTIAAAIPSMAAGAGLAIVDAKLLGDKAMPVQVLGKLALAAGLGHVFRNRPRTSCLVMGSILGGLGYQLAAQAAGGIVAPTKQDAAKKMAALVYADRRMASLVNVNGTLRTQPSLSGMGQTMGDGGTALPTMPIYDPVTLG